MDLARSFLEPLLGWSLMECHGPFAVVVCFTGFVDFGRSFLTQVGKLNNTGRQAACAT